RRDDLVVLRQEAALYGTGELEVALDHSEAALALGAAHALPLHIEQQIGGPRQQEHVQAIRPPRSPDRRRHRDLERDRGFVPYAMFVGSTDPERVVPAAELG